MGILSLLLYVLAIVLFVVAGWLNQHPIFGRVACYGLAAFAGAELIAHFPALH